MLKIGVSKKNAMELRLPVTAIDDSDMAYYFSVFKMGRLTFNLLIETQTFYSLLSKGKNIGETINSFSGENEYKFGIISDASLRSKVQTIVAKVKSLGCTSDEEILKLQKCLNGIPWRFLGGVTPAELREKRTPQ